MNNYLIEGSERQAKETLAAGGQVLTLQQLRKELNRLGYRIDPSASFNYTNTANEYSWLARSCHIVQISDGLSFANINARRDDNFKALQELRRNSVTVHRGRVYEI